MMILTSLSVLGVVALGGAVAAELSILIAVVVGVLVLVGLANAIVVFGRVRDALDE